MKTVLQLVFIFLACTKLAANPLIENNPQKNYIIHSLQRLADESGTQEENHFFCFRRPDGKDWIYWREGRRLWDTVLEPYYEKESPAELTLQQVWDMRLYIPFKPIDLDTWVVPLGADISGGTFLMHRDFVTEVIYECVLDGELVEIRKAPKMLRGHPIVAFQPAIIPATQK